MSTFRRNILSPPSGLKTDADILEKHAVSIFRVQDGDSKLLRNVGIDLRVYTASKPTGTTSSSSPP
jgi:hypothetical protein